MAEGKAGGRPGNTGRCRSNRACRSRRCRKCRTKGAAPTSRDSRCSSSGRTIRSSQDRVVGVCEGRDRKRQHSCESQKILAGLGSGAKSPAKIFSLD